MSDEQYDINDVPRGDGTVTEEPAAPETAPETTAEPETTEAPADGEADSESA